MKCLLEALQEGRLVELPEDRNKNHALTILANLIEAVPALPPGTDVTAAVMAREAMGSTALGKGWACPHGRVANEGDMLCAVGWSPSGLDYGAPDGRPVRIVAMYLIPLNQKNQYLREIAGIAKALQSFTDDSRWASLRSLAEARNALLDLISSALDTAGPEARARMVRLEAKQAASVSAIPGASLAGLTIQALTVVAGPGLKPLVLTQHRELIEQLESAPDLATTLGKTGAIDVAGWRILTRSTTRYAADRVLFDCIAIQNLQTPASLPTPM